MKKILTIVAIIAILGCVIIALNPFSNTPEDKSNGVYSVKDASVLTNGNLIILSDESEIKFTDLPSNVIICDAFTTIEKNDTVLIDGKWAKSVDKNELYSMILKMVSNQNPIILVDDTSNIITSSIGSKYATGFTPNAEVYCIFYNPLTDTSHGHSITQDSLEKSLSIAYAWSNEMLEDYISEII